MKDKKSTEWNYMNRTYLLQILIEIKECTYKKYNLIYDGKKNTIQLFLTEMYQSLYK